MKRTPVASADCGEDACAFNAAEETAHNRADYSGDRGNEVLDADPQTRHQDGQYPGHDADEHAYDRHCCGDPQYFCRAAQDEAQ